MNINLKATGINLTPAISLYAEKKVSSLKKYLENSDAALIRVEVGKTTNHHKEGNIFKAEIHITHGGMEVYAVASAEDLYAAIDLVENEAAHVLISKKGRRVRLLRKGERKIKQIARGLNFRKKADEYIEE